MSNDHVLFVWLDLYVSLCGQQHSKCKLAVCLVHPSLFCKLCPLSNPTNSATVCARFKQLYLSNHSEVETCSNELFFFSQCPILLPPKMLTFPPELPCVTLHSVSIQNAFISVTPTMQTWKHVSVKMFTTFVYNNYFAVSYCNEFM